MDLDGITTRLKALQRHAGTTDYASKVIADCAALLAEVERLRDEAEVLALRGEVERERTAVVAWLREEAEASAQTYTLQAGKWANRIDGLANHIERGEHRREEKP